LLTTVGNIADLSRQIGQGHPRTRYSPSLHSTKAILNLCKHNICIRGEQYLRQMSPIFLYYFGYILIKTTKIYTRFSIILDNNVYLCTR